MDHSFPNQSFQYVYCLLLCTCTLRIFHLYMLVSFLGMKSPQNQFINGTLILEKLHLYIYMNIVTLGTNVSIVQLDKSYLGHQPIYFHGAWHGEQNMIFGIIETVTKKCVIKIVPNCSRDVLMPIIHKHVHQGSTIYTDGLSTYRILKVIFTQNAFIQKVNMLPLMEPILILLRIYGQI